MKINLVFDTWRVWGRDIYGTMEYIELSSGQFHSGTTFHGTIELDDGDAEELRKAMDDGYRPTFWISP